MLTMRPLIQDWSSSLFIIDSLNTTRPYYRSCFLFLLFFVERCIFLGHLLGVIGRFKANLRQSQQFHFFQLTGPFPNSSSHRRVCSTVVFTLSARWMDLCWNWEPVARSFRTTHAFQCRLISSICPMTILLLRIWAMLICLIYDTAKDIMCQKRAQSRFALRYRLRSTICPPLYPSSFSVFGCRFISSIWTRSSVLVLF